MGWASGTSFFDAALDSFLDYVPLSERMYAVKRFYLRGFQYSDWDTQHESRYFEEYLVHIMHSLGEIEDEEYEWYVKGRYET